MSEKFTRNQDGLIKSVEYPRNEDGSINWRAMVKEEDLYPNASYFERNNSPTPKTNAGLKDHQLLIKLSGIKEVAKLRGFSQVKQEISHVGGDPNHVVAKCSIVWIPNEENPNEVVYEDVANATPDNCSGFATKFLETIAANRAFVRAVRNFLGIHVVGDDEIDKSGNVEVPTTAKGQMKSHDILKTVFGSHDPDGSWEAFTDFLRKCWKDSSYKNAEAASWGSFKDIPPTEVRKIIALIKKQVK